MAQLASVGVSWYTLLEQGRDVHPSREVLQSIADALQLTPDERQHLFFFANQHDLVETSASDELVSPALRRVLDARPPVGLGQPCWPAQALTRKPSTHPVRALPPNKSAACGSLPPNNPAIQQSDLPSMTWRAQQASMSSAMR